MKLLFVCVFTFLLCTVRAYADEWDATDKALGAAVATASVIDWAQTRYIATHATTLHENNPVLGLHPSLGYVNTYFVASIIGGALLADYLPSKYRKLFLGGAVLVELYFIGNNKHIGIGMAF